uniref:EGF-like domain-containing protein n=1 Tax=Glossina palpalis gambiensis TaxID=67801 RepID=A0A1B0C320_9MUSC
MPPITASLRPRPKIRIKKKSKTLRSSPHIDEDSLLKEQTAAYITRTRVNSFESDLVCSGAQVYLGGLPNDSHQFRASFYSQQGSQFKGCLGQTRVGDLLLPYFSNEEMYPRIKKVFATISFEFNSFCKSGGYCCDPADDYACTCQSGYDGDDSSNDIDECLTAECFNNSICIDKVADFLCKCSPGYDGRYYEHDIDELFCGKYSADSYMFKIFAKIRFSFNSFDAAVNVFSLTYLQATSSFDVMNIILIIARDPADIERSNLTNRIAASSSVAPPAPLFLVMTGAASFSRMLNEVNRLRAAPLQNGFALFYHVLSRHHESDASPKEALYRKRESARSRRFTLTCAACTEQA